MHQSKMQSQLTLFQREQVERTQKGNGFRDPAFMVNRNAPVHRWVPWIAGFSGQFIEDVFREFLPGNQKRRPLILDPFAGVGTTLVQAMAHDFDSVGFEINPYAALVSRVKLSATSVNDKNLENLIRDIEAIPKTGNGRFSSSSRFKPAGFRSRIPFFSTRVEFQVLQILELIEQMSTDILKDVARIAFGAVMVKVSNYSYEPSLSTRPGAGKPLQEDADVIGALVAKLREIQQDILWLQKKAGNKSRHVVYCDDFMSSYTNLDASSVDLMVTSPPYMNNYHYVRNTRPQLFWLGLVQQAAELRVLEQQNFGKFWQTVRSERPISLICEHAELSQSLETLRNIRKDAKAYGGPGWANYVASYFNDCDRFLVATKRVLRRRGVGVVVIGNSIIQGVPIETDRILAELAEKQGLKLEAIIPLRTKRVGASITNSSVRRGEKTKAKLYENAVVLRKR